MSLSKFYKKSASFVPEGLVNNSSSTQSGQWQPDQTQPPPAQSDTTAPVVPSTDKINGPHNTGGPDDTVERAESRTPADTGQNRPAEQSIPDSGDNQDFTQSSSPDISQQSPPAPSSPPPRPTQPPVAQDFDLESIREKAFFAGRIDGRRECEEDYEHTAQTMLSACKQLDSLKETILLNSLEEMRNLVFLIAEKIIRTAVTVEDETITATLEHAIRLAVKSEEFHVRINPEDLDIINESKKKIIDQVSGLETLVLKPDATIERGGCLLESTNCMVDATIDSQIEAIREEIIDHCEKLPPAVGK
ncbi:MAG: FliH/SctL family protein [Thermodesulfobacteriota bacterium]